MSESTKIFVKESDLEKLSNKEALLFGRMRDIEKNFRNDFFDYLDVGFKGTFDVCVGDCFDTFFYNIFHSLFDLCGTRADLRKYENKYDYLLKVLNSVCEDLKNNNCG